MNNNELIANRIRSTRIKSDMTLTEAARLSNMSKARISNWEQGLRVPKYEQIFELAKIYKTRPEYLIGWIDEKELSDKYSYYKPSAEFNSGDRVENVAYHIEYLERLKLNKNFLLSIKVTDESAAGEIKLNDELLIDTQSTYSNKNDLFAIESNGRIWIRELKPTMQNDSFIMSSGDKESHPDITYKKSELENIDIIGRVARISRDR